MHAYKTSNSSLQREEHGNSFSIKGNVRKCKLLPLLQYETAKRKLKHLAKIRIGIFIFLKKIWFLVDFNQV